MPQRIGRRRLRGKQPVNLNTDDVDLCGSATSSSLSSPVRDVIIAFTTWIPFVLAAAAQHLDLPNTDTTMVSFGGSMTTHPCVMARIYRPHSQATLSPLSLDML